MYMKDYIKNSPQLQAMDVDGFPRLRKWLRDMQDRHSEHVN